MIFVTRRVAFSAAHRYFLPQLSDDENRRLYGERAHPHGHGHDYTVEVTVRGETDGDSGLAVDFRRLSPILDEIIVESLDREYLTIQHPFCRGQVPTVENLSRLLWDAVAHAVTAAGLAATLHRVRVSTGDNLHADCCARNNDQMVLLTRTYEFSAAHRLHSVYLSDEQNLEIFGKCNNPYGHGHNFRVEITVQGEVDAETGLLCNLQDLDRIVREEILDRYDRRNLNLDAAEFRELNPTSENLVKVIWRRLERRLLGPTLYKISVAETSRNCFAYYGEGE